MITVLYGEVQNISNPGLDGEKWRYPVQWRRKVSGFQKDEEREIRIDVLLVGSFLDPLKIAEPEVEKVIFALVHEEVQDQLSFTDPPERISLKLDGEASPKARNIDPSKVPAPGDRIEEFESTDIEAATLQPGEAKTSPPTAFISYSRHDDPHMNMVKKFATRLREDGVDVTLDQWHAAPGDQLPEFMERSVRENDFVLIMCTPHYKAKSDSRTGGVGYEGAIITGEVYSKNNHRKFIPVLFRGDWENSRPSWLLGKYTLDLRGEPYSEDQYQELLNTLLGTREQAPPVGKKKRAIETTAPRADPAAEDSAAFGPIRILGVIEDGVGKPRNDGTRGCGLYEVPFKLSAQPPIEWVEYFIEAWDNPSQFTTMHRPGIARVEGERVILNGTTIEEIERYHRPTLKLALEVANQRYGSFQVSRQAEQQKEGDRMDEHQRTVRAIADRIKFD